MRNQKKRLSDRTSNSGRNNPIIMIAIAAVLIIVALVFMVRVLYYSGNDHSNSTKVEEGIAYLKSLENGSVEKYQDEINHLDKEYRMAEMENNPDAVWSAFNDAVIIGDSRAYGYYSYELVPENRVLAKAGGKITDIEEDMTYLPSIAALKPSYVFICMGLNDVGIGFYPEAKELADKYMEEIRNVLEVVPNAQVIVSSIIPTNEVGTAQNDAFARIDEYNEALGLACEEQGYAYVDVTDTIAEFGDPYHEDGIHLVKEYYLGWAMRLVLAME